MVIPLALRVSRVVVFTLRDSAQPRASASAAAFIAISTSAEFEFGAVAKTCPVAGLTKSVLLSDFDSTLLPFMKLLNFSMERDYALGAKKCSYFPVTSKMLPWEIRQKQASGGAVPPIQPSRPAS